MKVLVTGAFGFIGSNLCSYFISKGWNVIGWDIHEDYDFSNKIEKVDLLDEKQIYDSLIKVKPDLIIHCAGSANVGKSVENPSADYNGNVTITHNLLFALHKCKFVNTRVVFLSSAAVYGNPMHLPIDETMAMNPLSPYALHKVMCEDICRYFVINYNIDVKIVRIFSAYGIGLRKQIFADMYQKAVTTGKLCMFGTGLESRDYINIKDVIQAIYLVSIKSSAKEIIYNIANGEEITIKAVTEIFAQAYGISKDLISFDGVEREGDPLNWKANIDKLKSLGYKKTIDIKEGIISYVNWVKDN